MKFFLFTLSFRLPSAQDQNRDFGAKLNGPNWTLNVEMISLSAQSVDSCSQLMKMLIGGGSERVLWLNPLWHLYGSHGRNLAVGHWAILGRMPFIGYTLRIIHYDSTLRSCITILHYWSYATGQSVERSWSKSPIHCGDIRRLKIFWFNFRSKLFASC